jgi:hypothetical protein
MHCCALPHPQHAIAQQHLMAAGIALLVDWLTVVWAVKAASKTLQRPIPIVCWGLWEIWLL